MMLANKVVAVTGGGRGIGREIALLCAREGAAVVVNDPGVAQDGDGGDAGPAERTVADIRADGGRAHANLASVADPSGAESIVADAIREFGRIDAVVNNAGIGVSSLRPDGEVNLPSIEELTTETWDNFFAINVRAPMLLVKATLPHMRGFGRIINNTTSFRTMLRVLPYGATKSALESMSAIWAAELKDRGITVNVLIPGGPTDTPFIADGAGWDRAKMLKPTIMGPPAVWLISDEAAGYTGQRIIAANWDVALPGAEAAKKAGRAIGWPELGADAVWLKG
jgi:NAD(P)-dependent dehydrogenase (short-subunit alcohol dehydrogenase family)